MIHINVKKNKIISVCAATCVIGENKTKPIHSSLVFYDVTGAIALY